MIELPSLYTHQEDLRDRTREALRKYRRVILTAPPGMGKTRTAKWILGASANREPSEKQTGRSLFAVHRRGLVDNASNSFAEEPELPHGVVMSGHRPKWGANVHVASIDTLLSWFIKGDKGDNGTPRYETSVTFDLIVFDETHSHLPKLQKFLKHHDQMRQEQGKHPAFVLGLTATPQAKGLADVYREIVPGPPPQWLIDNGFLSPFRYFRATQGRLDLLKKSSTGNFTEKSEAAAMEGLAGDLVRDWKQFAEGRPTIGFFPRRSHAQDAAVLLAEAGIKTDYIDGETSDEDRQRIFWQLSNGDLDYICNVQVVERGTDLPCIQCVQLCVAIGSRVRFLQMVGRGSRISDGKQDCIVLDHGGNVQRHGFFEDEIPWSLDMSRGNVGEVATRPTIECPECSAIYRGGKCRQCGYEPTKRELKAKGLEFDGQELREAKKSERKKTVKSAEDLMAQALYVAGRRKGTWKTACAMFFKANRSQGTAYKIPRKIVVGGHRYQMVPFGSSDAGLRVSFLYPFTVEKGNHGGPFYLGR
jgi:DNA repair protein RadD